MIPNNPIAIKMVPGAITSAKILGRGNGMIPPKNGKCVVALDKAYTAEIFNICLSLIPLFPMRLMRSAFCRC